MDIKERTNVILEKIQEVAEVAGTAADHQERISNLEESCAMLMECILEMSEIIYA
jgi:hypothetical protein